MSFSVRFTPGAKNDIDRLYAFLLQHDIDTAERALQAIKEAMKFLETYPFSCRKANPKNPWLREILVPFGNSGYLMLFEIENAQTITILAIRHQREEDYY